MAASRRASAKPRVHCWRSASRISARPESRKCSPRCSPPPFCAARPPHRRALVRALASAAPADVRTAALLACKKKGKWRQALTCSPDHGARRRAARGVPRGARGVPPARAQDGGARAPRADGLVGDTVALNSSSTSRGAATLTGAAMWDRRRAPSAASWAAPALSATPVPTPAVGPTADGRSYLQLLQLCGLTGRWAVRWRCSTACARAARRASTGWRCPRARPAVDEARRVAGRCRARGWLKRASCRRARSRRRRRAPSRWRCSRTAPARGATPTR